MNTLRNQTPADAIYRKNTTEEMKCLVKDSGVTNITYARDGYIYIIENSTSEWSRSDQGYYLSIGDAVDGIKNCCDWYRSDGTGRIYRVEPGTRKTRTLVWQNT